MHFSQKETKPDRKGCINDRIMQKVIHTKKAHKIGESDLYTNLYTLSTRFLYISGRKL